MAPGGSGPDTSRSAPGGHLILQQISKSYGDSNVLASIDLEVLAGEFLTILGPSGSGKTTLLKIVAGFDREDGGQIFLGGRSIAAMDPAGRNIGMVFQHYALFPHMSVLENVAFPLRMRRLPQKEIEERVHDALTLVKLVDFGDRLPKQLSGGQQQRVALARAVVFRPSLLLLDEPFGALDRKLREQMQLEVRSLQRQLGVTTVFITHDQEEALIMSDRVAVMNHGRLEQIGTPGELYETPATAFIADFIGESNILAGTVEATDAGMAVRVAGDVLIHVASGLTAGHRGRQARILIRPERILDGSPPEGGRFNEIVGKIVEMIYVGTAEKCRVRTGSGCEILARFPVGRFSHRHAVGSAVRVTFSTTDPRVVDVN